LHYSFAKVAVYIFPSSMPVIHKPSGLLYCGVSSYSFQFMHLPSLPPVPAQEKNTCSIMLC